MPLAVSQRFLNASQADVNRPVSKVLLLLGNYLSAAAYGTTAASSGDDGSGNFPAAGAIDGDRTEINVGAAAGADNDTGLSSWRSAGIPDHGDIVTLTLTLSQARTLNRIKLYHLSGHGLKTYKFSWWNGSAFVDFAATSDIAIAGQVSIVTAGTLDIIDFPDVITTKIKLTVTHTQVANDAANVVELEAYRKVDITSRVKKVAISRQRDYKIANPMAASVAISCINDDRFFSTSHVPTAAEAALGFVNQELKPGVGILVSMGFDYYGPQPELVTNIIGQMDGIQINPKNRDAVIQGRDGTKRLINKIDSSKLKTAQRIDQLITYVLNRSNISNYEMAIDSVPLAIDYFFSDQQAVLDTLRDLTQAAVDAVFYFDESGIATFKNFALAIPLQHTYTSNADWLAGVISGDLQIDGDQLDFANTNAGFGEANTDSGNLLQLFRSPHFDAGPSGLAFRFIAAGTGAITKVQLNAYFAMNGLSAASTALIRIGLYSDSISNTPGVLLASTTFTATADGKVDPFGDASPSQNTNLPVIKGTAYWIAYEPDPSNVHTLSWDIIGRGAPGGGWSGGQFVYFRATPSGSWAPGADPSGLVINTSISGSFTFTGKSLLGQFIAPILDTGIGTISYGSIVPTEVLNAGAISFETRSSPDGVTWDPYIATSISGLINSVVRRYLQVRLTVSLASLSNLGPILFDFTVNWVAGSGHPKYPGAPASFTFSFDSTLLDVQQELADTLGGDSSILNDVTVQAQPLVLTGADTDTTWQGTSGIPPANISGANPLPVTNGQILILTPVVSGGMDISRMGGANPAAAVVVAAGGAAVAWSFISIHPTLPVLKIVVTGNGTLTDLRIIGKSFSNANFIQAQRATDPASIAQNDDRQTSISNSWILTPSVAAAIAAAIVANSKQPTAYIPQASTRLQPSCQLGDRVTVKDVNLDLTGDYIVVGCDHNLEVNIGKGDAMTKLKLLAVPAGS